MKWLNAIIDLFYPNFCIGCKRYATQQSNFLCSSCLLTLSYIPKTTEKETEVKSRFYGKLALEHANATFLYDEDSIIRNLLHALKYQNQPKIGVFLATLTTAHFQNHPIFKWSHYLVAIPLHSSKQKKRGYNQLHFFGKTLAENYNLIYLEDYLIKTTKSNTQTHKNIIERAENKTEFSINPKYNNINNKHILLLDDVITTGSTLEVAGNYILKNTSNKISILTIAYTR